MKTNEFLPLNLQFFSEDLETTESATTPAEAQKTESSPTTKEEKTVPYDRFKKINDDLKTFKQTFESLGLSDLDALKSLVVEYNTKKSEEDERKRAEMSEIERLQTDLQALTDTKNNAETELEKLQNALRNEKITNAFIKAAPSVNIPSDRIDAAMKLVDLSAVNVEDGKVVGLDDVMSSLVEQYSFLVAEQKKPQKPIGEPSNGALVNEEAKTLEAQLEDAKRAKDFNKVIELSNKIAGIFKAGR